MPLAAAPNVHTLVHDVRYALRALRRAPFFTAVALTTLALGTAANVTVFGFVSALLLRPPSGVADPWSLVSVYTSDFSSGPYGSTSVPDFVSLSESGIFSALAAEDAAGASAVRAGASVERVHTSRVSGSYFHTLGVRPALGRFLEGADSRAGAPPVVVISYRFWERALGTDPDIIGQSLELSGQRYTIVGVASPGFAGHSLGSSPQLWLPLRASAEPAARGDRGLEVVGRLRPGLGWEAAQTELSALAARLAEAYPESNRGTLAAPGEPRGMTVLPHTRLPPDVRRDAGTLSGILMAGAAIVLLVACANVGGLLLSRATNRSSEVALRLALGATRGRVLRQFFTESLVLATVGSALGLMASLWTADVLPSFLPAEQAAVLDTSVEMRVVIFVLTLSIASGVLCGLAPALQLARKSSAEMVRTSDPSAGRGHGGTGLRRVLVMGQVAAAVVLLIAAALLAQSVRNAAHADLGFGLRRAVVASIELPPALVTSPQGLAYYARVIRRMEQLPSVERAALTHSLPLSGRSRRGFRMEGYAPRPGEDMELHFNIVSDRYFDTMQIRLLEGRGFTRADGAEAPRVVVVNEALAQRYFAGRATGRHLFDSHGVELTIVGVVPSAPHLTIHDAPLPIVYYPLAQNYTPEMSLIVPTASEPSILTDTVRAALQDLDPSIPVFRVTTLEAHLEEATAEDRLTASLLGVCGAVAMLLATIGIYGVTAYGVLLRGREIAVRLALGARPRHIVGLVAREGLQVTVFGAGAGLLISAIATRALGSMLYGVGAHDPATLVAVPVALAAVALLATWGPVRRALRLDPVATLRGE